MCVRVCASGLISFERFFRMDRVKFRQMFKYVRFDQIHVSMLSTFNIRFYSYFYFAVNRVLMLLLLWRLCFLFENKTNHS